MVSGEQLAVDRGGGDVRTFGFTPDGSGIVTGELGRVRVVGCDPCGPVDRVLALARRQLARGG